MSSYTVAQIMRRDVPVLTPATPIRTAVALLVEKAAAAAPVEDDAGRLAGILTQKDCFRPALHASYYSEWSGRVADQMTREVVSIDMGEDIIRAAEMFLESPHRVFPVTDGDRIAGVLHRSAVLAFLSRTG